MTEVDAAILYLSISKVLEDNNIKERPLDESINMLLQDLNEHLHLKLSIEKENK